MRRMFLFLFLFVLYYFKASLVRLFFFENLKLLFFNFWTYSKLIFSLLIEKNNLKNVVELKKLAFFQSSCFEIF